MHYKQNLHIHTTYVDGKDKPEEMVVEAIRKGFNSIGFSEHTYNKHSAYHHQMLPEDMAAYRKDVMAVKAKYEGKIDIFCGLEDEYFSEVSADGYDYLIASVHYLDVGGQVKGFDGGLESTLDYINTYFGGSGMAFARKYFETVLELPKKRRYDILGHFDLVCKNNEKGCFLDETSKEYLELGFETIRALRGKIPFFEVNTGAISRGYKTFPYPQMEFLKEFNRCGFGVVITSDCHDKAFIDCCYEDAEKMIAEAGFESKWILTDSGFKEIDL